MENGVINIENCLIFLLFFVWITGCNKGDRDNILLIDDSIIEIKKSDSVNLVIELYDNGMVKVVQTENILGVKNGINVAYHPNGLAKEKFNWNDGKLQGGYWIYNELGEVVKYYNYEDGKKEGDMYEYLTGTSIRTHRIFRNDNAIYSEIFENGKKIFNSPIPLFLKETISNKIYKTTISFPFKFRGELDIFLRDSIEFEKEYVDKYKLDLKIVNFNKEWKQYELRLVYEPAEDDTLIGTDYVYNRTVDLD